MRERAHTRCEEATGMVRIKQRLLCAVSVIWGSAEPVPNHTPPALWPKHAPMRCVLYIGRPSDDARPVNSCIQESALGASTPHLLAVAGGLSRQPSLLRRGLAEAHSGWDPKWGRLEDFSDNDDGHHFFVFFGGPADRAAVIEQWSD